MKKLHKFLFMGLTTLALVACSQEDIDTAKKVYKAGREIQKITKEIKKSTNKNNSNQQTKKPITSVKDGEYPTWTYEEFPEYYAVLGEANVNESDYPKSGVIYQGLDSLGRTLSAHGTITHEMVQKSAGHRENWERNSEPSGWFKNPNGRNKKERGAWNAEVKVKLSNGKTYSGWFYNKSHLFADSLGGKAARDNVVTGTRMQNVGNNDKNSGIQYIEWKVLEYVKNNPKVKVFYKAEPIYIGEELVPRYVKITAQSTDKVINEEVLTFNYANGFTIDYNTGEFTKN